MTDINSAGKAYARFVMSEMNLSPSALAKGAKLASTTLTRALNDPTHQFNLSTTTINKIAKFSGISPAPFFQAGDFAEMALSPLHREDMYLDAPLGRVVMSDTPTPRNLTYVIGEAAAGVWRNPEIAGGWTAQALWIAIPDTKETQAFAIIAADESASPFVRKGEYAICRRSFGQDEDLNDVSHGSLVVVERWMNGVMELSIRRAFTPSNEPEYLRSDNPDPKFAEKLLVPKGKLNEQEIKIIGHVMYALRDVRNRQMEMETLEVPSIDPFP